jgi:hypothetical protein
MTRLARRRQRPNMYIGYERLEDLCRLVVTPLPIYVTMRVRSQMSEIPGSRVDEHAIVVSTADLHHRIHYGRIPVVRLVYVNGVSFDPNHDAWVTEVERAREIVWAWLKEAGRVVVQGMIAMPEGMQEVTTLMPSVPYGELGMRG